MTDTIASLTAERDSLLAQVARMRVALESAANQFRYYEVLHRHKGTEDGDDKAKTNSSFAVMCERAASIAAEEG